MQNFDEHMHICTLTANQIAPSKVPTNLGQSDEVPQVTPGWRNIHGII